MAENSEKTYSLLLSKEAFPVEYDQRHTRIVGLYINISNDSKKEKQKQQKQVEYTSN